MTPRPDFKQAATWLILAAAVGFAVPFIFSDGLRWQRSVFLIPYVLVVGAFLAWYFRSARIPLRELIRSLWPYGAIGTLIACFLVSRSIFDQPASARPEGGELIFALAWVGVVYGLVDALFLNVMPVLAVQGPGFVESNPSRRDRLTLGLAALAASVLVTVAYHAGYAEFRGPAMILPIIGNVIITSAYVLTGSQLAAIITHIFMHSAAVFRGMETVVQLPPHY